MEVRRVRLNDNNDSAKIIGNVGTLREDLVTTVNNLKNELEQVKSEKRQQKHQIQQWIDEFTKANGREPSKDDKEHVRPMFNLYKDLEIKCKGLTMEIEPLEARMVQMSTRSLADLEPRLRVLEQQLEKKTSDRKAQKHIIQDWMDDFTRKNGREPAKEDKQQVRHLFNRYKDLEAECKELSDEVNELKQVKKELMMAQAMVSTTTKEEMEATRDIQSYGEVIANGGVMDKTVPLDLLAPDQPRGAAAAADKRILGLQERFQKLAEQHQELASIESELLTSPTSSAMSTTASLSHAESSFGPTSTAVLGRRGSSGEEGGGVATAGAGGSKEDALSGGEGKEAIVNDGTRFGLGSDFSKDARRDEMFLTDEVHVPEPRLLGLHDVVLDMRQELEIEPIPDYLGDFEELIPEVEVVVAKIPVEELEKKEKLIEEVRIKNAQEEAAKYRKRELDLAWREHASRTRVAKMEVETRKRIQGLKQKVAEENLASERAMQRHFVAAKERLEKLIYSQKAHFTEKYGSVVPGQMATARRFLINWDFEPQPIEMRIHLMRAVKNKLPAGRYCFLLTPYDRLGGNPITWSKLGFQGMGHNRPPATKPVKHKGRFFDTTIRVDQSVFALCPSRKQVRPSNCLIIEAFYLAGKDNLKDQIVGWGVLPMCNPRFRMVNGRFKIPLLKGEPTPLIDKYAQIDDLYSDDLTFWLCNLYVDVRHLSKEHMDKEGQLHREYDLEYDYINQKLLLGPAPPALKKELKKAAAESLAAAAAAAATKEAKQGAVDPPSAAGAERDELAAAEEGDVIMSNKKQVMTEEERLAATDPSHPDSKHHRWAPETNDTWYSKREKLFRHPPRSKPKSRSTAKSSGAHQALTALAAESPLSAADGSPVSQKQDGGSRILSSFASGSRSPGLASLASLSPNYAGTRRGLEGEGDEDSASDSSEDEEEAKSSGDEWVLDGGETRPLLVGKEMESVAKQSSLAAGGKAKVRRRRQEGSRWDAQGLGIESTIIGQDGDNKGHHDDGKERKQTAKKLGGTTRRFESGQEKLQWFKLNDPQEMEYYSMAVAEDPTKMEQPLPQEIMRSKMLYLKNELLADLGLSNIHTTEFWVTLTIYTMACWMRMYIHYIGQYLYLKAQAQPVYVFEAALYCMRIKYISTTGEALKELCIVLVGPLSNILVFLGLFLAGWAMMRFIGQIPDSTSKAIAAYGIATLLDPLLIFIVDVLSKHFNCSTVSGCEVNYTTSTCKCFIGDAFKLYERFRADENNGITGIFITIIVYIAEFLLTGFILYNYLILVHMNGRMLDIYKRLHGTSEDFFCPHDFEVTFAEIAYICEKAKKWTHPKGTRRRIAVCDYELTDPLEPGFAKEVTTHLAIYNLEIDGSKTLYRHFLRMPDGTIIELFDVVAKSLGSQYDSLEKLLLTDQNVVGGGARGFFANFLK